MEDSLRMLLYRKNRGRMRFRIASVVAIGLAVAIAHVDRSTQEAGERGAIEVKIEGSCC